MPSNAPVDILLQPQPFSGVAPEVRLERKRGKVIVRITEVKAELLRMPLPRPMQSGSSSGKKGGPVSHINMPILFITTEDGTRSVGCLCGAHADHRWPDDPSTKTGVGAGDS